MSTSRAKSKNASAQPAATPPEQKRVLTPEVKLERIYQELHDDPKFAHLRYRHRLITGHGPIKPHAMVIVEMPEKNDENIGVALTGAGGIVLHELLTGIDLRRASHIFVTPVLKYRPTAAREATMVEIAASLPYLLREIELVDPKFLITCGRFVNRLFFPKQVLSDITGEILPWKKRLVMPTLAPQQAIHDRIAKQTMLNTFRMLGELV